MQTRVQLRGRITKQGRHQLGQAMLQPVQDDPQTRVWDSSPGDTLAFGGEMDATPLKSGANGVSALGVDRGGGPCSAVNDQEWDGVVTEKGNWSSQP